MLPSQGPRQQHLQSIANVVCSLTSFAHLSAQQQLPTTTLDKVTGSTSSGSGQHHAPSINVTAPESGSGPATRGGGGLASAMSASASSIDASSARRIEITIAEMAQFAQLPPALLQNALSFSSTAPTLNGAGEPVTSPSKSDTSPLHVALPLRLSVSVAQFNEMYQQLLLTDCERLSETVRSIQTQLRAVATPPFEHEALRQARDAVHDLVGTAAVLVRSLAVTSLCLAAHVQGVSPQTQESLLIRSAYVASSTLDLAKLARKLLAGHQAADAAHAVLASVSSAATKVARAVNQQQRKLSTSFPRTLLPGGGRDAPATALTSNETGIPQSLAASVPAPPHVAVAGIGNHPGMSMANTSPTAKPAVPKLFNLVKQLQTRQRASSKYEKALDDVCTRYIRSMHLFLDIVQGATAQYRATMDAQLATCPDMHLDIYIPAREMLRELVGGDCEWGTEGARDVAAGGAQGVLIMMKSLSQLGPWAKAFKQQQQRGGPTAGAGGFADDVPTMPRGTGVGGAPPSAPAMPVSVMSAEQYAALCMSASTEFPSSSTAVAGTSMPAGLRSTDSISALPDPAAAAAARTLYPTISKHAFDPDSVPAFPVPLSSRLGTFALIKPELDERLVGGPRQNVARLLGRGAGWQKVWLELDVSYGARHELVVYPLLKIRVHDEEDEIQHHYMANTAAAPTAHSLKYAVVEHAKNVPGCGAVVAGRSAAADVVRVRLASGMSLLVHVGAQRKESWFGHLRSEAAKASQATGAY
ncbi:hypothetical protein H9P43_004046 [Blastocladiella emersonii ATCC 22665]|nr:hypothetical protein H9P43_004046 [Blastocladiella emersonii ATCC 22665]